jgi:hypothetical protein
MLSPSELTMEPERYWTPPLPSSPASSGRFLRRKFAK